jgi:hypothetical protein
MAIRTAESKASSGQQKQGSRLGKGPVEEPTLADGMRTLSAGGDTYWGDRFAFKIWLLCFLGMVLMLAHDMITALIRGSGGN